MYFKVREFLNIHDILDENYVIYSEYQQDGRFMVKDLMQKLGSKDAPDGEISLLPEDVSINSYEVQKDLLVIDFSKEYSK